jgi:hypothetical protein
MNFRTTETYVVTLEESTDDVTGDTVIAAVALPSRWIRAAHAYWHRHLRRFGVARDAELHSTELIRGKGIVRDIEGRFPRPPGVSKNDHQRRIGRLLVRRSLRRIASINEMRIGLFCIPTPRIPIAYAEAFAAIGAGIALRASSRGVPRVAHILIDGQDRKLPRLHYESTYLLYRSQRLPRRFRSDRREWMMGGATLAESGLSELVQMADIVAFAGLKARLGDPITGGYAQHDLIDFASTCWGREIDLTNACINAATSAFGQCSLLHAIP